MRKLRSGMAIATISGLLLLAPATAHATAGVSDPVGDVGSAAATDDIINVDMSLTHTNITLSMTMNAPLEAFSNAAWSSGGSDGRVDAFSLSLNGEPESQLKTVLIDGDSAQVFSTNVDETSPSDSSDMLLCTATDSISSATLTVTVPADCLGTPGKVTAWGITASVSTDGDGNTSLTPIDFAPATGDTLTNALTKSVPGGYWELGGDGGVFSFGDAQYYGSTGGMHLNAPVVGMSPTPASDGYRFVASDGGVFNYGSAQMYGSMGGRSLNAPIVGMTTTPSGHGYYLVASDGGVFAFGDATFEGSKGGQSLNKPIVGIMATSNQGYYLVASDGGVFAFGDATFEGSKGGQPLARPVSGIGGTNGAYYLVAQDGGVFSYGDAASHFYGSGAGNFDGTTVVGIATYTNGYRIVGADGSVENFGASYDFSDVQRYGITPNMGVVGMANSVIAI